MWTFLAYPRNWAGHKIICKHLCIDGRSSRDSRVRGPTRRYYYYYCFIVRQTARCGRCCDCVSVIHSSGTHRVRCCSIKTSTTRNSYVERILNAWNGGNIGLSCFFVCVSLYWNRFKQVAVQIIWILINKAKCYFESNYYGTNIWIYLLPHNGRIHIRHIVKNVARTYAWIAFLFITLSFFFVALFMLRRCNDDNGDAGVHLPGEQRACGAAAVQYREAGHET